LNETACLALIHKCGPDRTPLAKPYANASPTYAWTQTEKSRDLLPANRGANDLPVSFPVQSTTNYKK